MPTYTGTDGNDTYTGTTEADIINGGLGNDILNGSDGNDEIDGGAGQDQTFGDAGDDTLIVSVAPVSGEIYNGGADTDTLRFMASAGNLVTTNLGLQYQGALFTSTLSSIERLEFGSISGSGLSVLLSYGQIGAGLSSTAEIVGGDGNDQLTILAGSSGTYTIQNFTYSNWTNAINPFDTGDAVVLVGTGFNDYTFNATAGHLGYQALVGANGNDTLNGSDGMEILNGGGGVNTLNGFGGDDILIAANNTPMGGVPTNNTFLGSVFNGGEGFDYLSVGGYVFFEGTLDSIEGIYFQPAFTATSPGTASQTEAELEIGSWSYPTAPVDLHLRGTGTLSVLLEDEDEIDASQWVHEASSNVFVQFFGGDGDESVIGTSGNDRFSGGFGNSLFTGGAGNDQFEAGEGQATVTDFTIGEDRVDLQDMNITSWEQLQPYLSQDGANVVFSRLYGGVPQTMTLLNVSLASLSASDFIFQTGDDNDTRNGTEFDDELIGGNGNDTLNGFGGNDYLYGGAGDDSAFAGTGDDEVYGAEGNDFLNGQAGNDLIDGGDGDDLIRSAAGDDTLIGGAGNDNLRGGSGVDSFDGGTDTGEFNNNSGYGDRISFYELDATEGVVADLRTGVISNDGFGNVESMTGIESLGSDTAHADTFYGNDSQNALYGNLGDSLYGFAGDDYFLTTSAAAVVDGGDGIDTLGLGSMGGWLTPDSNGDGLAESAAAASNGWTVNLTTGATTDGYGNNGTVANVENVDGTELGDIIIGTDGANVLGGGAGNDVLRGGEGDDELYGDDGNDFLSQSLGGTFAASSTYGNDTYDGGAGIDRVSLFTTMGAGVTVDLNISTAQNTGAAGIDTFIGIEHVTATFGDDMLTGNAAANWFWTFGGNDTLFGNEGDDYFTVGFGDKIIDGGTGVDTVEIYDDAFEPVYSAEGITVSLSLQGQAQAVGTGNWTLTGIENLAGWYGSDDLTGDDNTNVLTGGQGDDILRGMAGNDILAGDGFFGTTADGEIGYEVDNDWEGGNDVLEGGDGDDSLYGGSGNDTLRGGAGNDLAYGGTGNDFLTEGTVFGDDLYDGGEGSDRISYFADNLGTITIDLRVAGGQNTGRGTDTLVGIEHITADYGNDNLIGNDEANWFWTFSGTDTLIGNGGNDYFTVGNGDKTADGGSGIDTIEIAEFAYVPVYTSEGITVSLALQGTAQDTGAGIWNISNFENLGGFFGDDELTGDGNANVLAGALGNDTLDGGDGDDTLAGDGTWIFENGAQVFIEDNVDDGPGGGDILLGGAGNDTLIGGGGNDYLDGGTGADFMKGGTGDDTFVVDDADDNVVETPDAGTDHVRSLISYTLGANLENLTLLGSAALTATGNSLNNVITGNSGVNVISGGGGTDTFIGGAGDDHYVVEATVTVMGDGGYAFAGVDQVIEAASEGNDTVYSNASYTLSANVENLTLNGVLNLSGFGNALNNVIIGNAGNNFLQGFDGDDYLDGGAGNDHMIGGNGNDTYVVDSVNDMIDPESPSAEGGLDQVISSIDYTLAFGLEYLTLTGTAVVGNGNTHANTIVGNAMNNTLFGDGGDDTIAGGNGNDSINGGFGADIIIGGAGIDTLTGGADADTFADTAAGLNGDTITDLTTADRIVISDANLANFTFSLSGNTLTYSGGSVTVQNVAGYKLVASAAAGGGVQLSLVANEVENDFNGDGRSDILWRYTDGTFMDWLGQSNGSFVNNYAASAAYLSTSWQLLGTGDFNGDAREDMLLRFDSGLFMNWLGQANGSFLNNYNNAAYLDNSWNLLSIGDVNGDNREDLIFRNDNGLVLDMLGQADGSFFNNYGMASYLNSSWQVTATGDFNGDGRTDILWENDNGLVMNWLGQADGSFLNNYAKVAFLDNNWTVAGTGDFNGDGRDDILWQNTNGLVMDWLGQQDGSYVNNYGNAAYLDSSWNLVGTDDYNGDGLSDILWRNDSGLIMNWLGQSNGTFLNNYGNAAYLDNSWDLVDAGDYNGDGRDDLLFRNDNGLVIDWLGQEDGSFLNNYANAAYLNSSWVVQNDDLL